MAEQDESVVPVGRGAVQHRLVGLHRPGLDARQPQQRGTVVGCVPARAGPGEQHAAPGDALGGALGRTRIAQHPPEIVRLTPHRLSHRAHGVSLLDCMW